MSEGDLCPRCDEEYDDCKCKKDSSPHTTYDDDGDILLYDGWYDPEK